MIGIFFFRLFVIPFLSSKLLLLQFADTKSNFSWATFKTRLRYYVPVFSWMPTYSLNTFWGDFFASLTVTAILLPSGLSFSVLAKLPPVHGLYSIVIPGVLYSFLGTSRCELYLII